MVGIPCPSRSHQPRKAFVNENKHTYAASAVRRTARKAERSALAKRARIQRRLETMRRARARAQIRHKEKLGAQRKVGVSGKSNPRPGPKPSNGASTKKLPRRLRSVSEKRSLENVEYEKNVTEWNRRENHRCEFIGDDGHRCSLGSMQRPHHRNLRTTREHRVNKKFFVGLCFFHHRWVHDNPWQAEALGLIVRVYDKH